MLPIRIRSPVRDYQLLGEAELEYRKTEPKSAWDRVPEATLQQTFKLALDQSDASSRDFAGNLTENKHHFSSKATVYRSLKARDPSMISPHFVIKASDQFHMQNRLSETWQTDFTCFKNIGRGSMCLSTLIDEYSPDVIA